LNETAGLRMGERKRERGTRVSVPFATQVKGFVCFIFTALYCLVLYHIILRLTCESTRWQNFNTSDQARLVCFSAEGFSVRESLNDILLPNVSFIVLLPSPSPCIWILFLFFILIEFSELVTLARFAATRLFSAVMLVIWTSRS
jgi:hypothetical protein